MKNWILHQKYTVEDALPVNSYFNISNNPEQESLFESNPIFKSELGKPLFKRKQKKQIGFIK